MKLNILFISALLSFFCLFAGSAQSLEEPKSFDDFFDASKMKREEAYYTVYRSGDQFYLEIPKSGLGKEVLVTANVVQGYSNLVSPASGIIRFKLGRKNTIEVYRNLSTTFSRDSVDFCMMNSIAKSGLIPVYLKYSIVATGKDEKSFIIDITSELNSPMGMFDLSSSGVLNSPDPQTSGVESFRHIDRGVVFTALRSQNSTSDDMSRKTITSSYSYRIEMLLQELPERQQVLKANNKAYGFETIEHTEYDTKEYVALTKEYVKKWNLQAAKQAQRKQKQGVAVEPIRPIHIYIDPVTPKPFVASIKNAVKQWEMAFEKAGWKNVFSYDTDGAMDYRKILFRWGNAYGENSHSMVENPVTGEILCARINLMDESAKEMMPLYFFWCGLTDMRVQQGLENLEIRKEILTSQLAQQLGHVLGLKTNLPAATAFSCKQLRSQQWLSQWGPTASVMTGLNINYLVQPNDGITSSNLLSKVSIYDDEAIEYLYGKRMGVPSLKSTFYAESDANDPSSQASFLSNDILEASVLGIANLKNIYPQIPQMTSQWPNYENDWEGVTKIIQQAFSMYQFYVHQVATLVGGKSNREIIRGVNEVPVTYVSRAKQLAALAYIEKAVFDGTPEWFKNEEILRINPVNTERFSVIMATSILENLIKPEVISSLLDAEEELGDKAFTYHELLIYLDRVVFNDYNLSAKQSRYKLDIQAQFTTNLATLAAANNITAGLNDTKSVILSYLLHTRNKVKEMQEKHSDPLVRANCSLMLLKMDREFFSKSVM